jgi:outer membrane murein-binding lipoprotein Lpp
MSWSDTDFAKMDAKLDELVTAVAKLAANERRLDDLESDHKSLMTEVKAVDERRAEDRRELDKWINRSYGVWAFGATLIALAQMASKALGGQ